MVVGIAINLLAVGVTRFFLRLAFDSSSNSPRVPGFTASSDDGQYGASADRWRIHSSGWASFRWSLGVDALSNPVRVARSRGRREAGSGAVSRRAGETGALARGHPVGMSASLGGAYLALDQHQFTDGMTAGRGFIALAAVIFGKWDPKRVTVACLLFAAAETMQIRCRALQIIPSQFVEMIPYVLTIVALAGVVGRAVQPSALGKAVD